MLQHIGINQLRRGILVETVWRRCQSLQKFLSRRFSSVSFRSRWLRATIWLVVTYGVVVTAAGVFVLQPSLLQPPVEASQIRNAHHVDYDLALVRQQRQNFYKLNLVVMALFLGLGVALALILSRQLHQPMRRLIDGAQRIGSGDFDHRINIAGDDELERLGKSFNQMASYLKLREEQLQRSEALYRHLVQDALDGIFVVDRALRFIEVNEKFCQMLGCRREEVLRSTLSQILASTTGAEEHLNDIFARRPFRGELVFQNHLPRIIDLNAAPIPMGRDELYMGIARDITEKKHYEVELHRAAELRELLLRTMSDGVAVLDREGYLLVSNRALEEILEMSHTELMRHRFTVLKNGWQFRTLDDRGLPPEDSPIHLALNERQRISDYRLKICRPNKQKYLSVNSAPLYDERQELVGAIVALRDITAAVQSEHAREFLQQKMQQTAKLASLGELAAGVAHEINNPMTGIINYAQILLNRAPDGHNEKSLLQVILEESDRVTKIVHNLLTFARQQPQECGLASIADILDSSLHLMGHRLSGDGVTVICEIPPNLPPLKCRSQQIQQVFINLLSNAHHALNEKYPGAHENKRLKIQACSFQRNGQHIIRTEFQDTGAGIAPEIMPKIFDPFFTTKNRSVGTGLGLSISYGIVKDHRGEIIVESLPGDHTTFIVELPTEYGLTTAGAA
jgi:PAS domain S-box-containing protein